MDQGTEGAGRTMGGGGGEWRQLTQVDCVLERHNHIVSTESVADQRRDLAHARAIQAVELATVE